MFVGKLDGLGETDGVCDIVVGRDVGLNDGIIVLLFVMYVD
jgi:hypothetical protein